jgi:signal peptidase II
VLISMKGRFFLVTLAVLLFDHLTKYYISTTMTLFDVIEIIPGYLRISYVRNSGVAFGLFDSQPSPWKPYFLAGMAVAAVVVILIYSRRTPMEKILLQTALAVTTGGILGNLLDRIVHGFVVDFVEFHIRDSFHWPTFNVADSAITIGIAMLLIDTLKHTDQDVSQEHADPLQQ